MTKKKKEQFTVKTYELYAIPVQAWTGPVCSRGCGSQISKQSAHDCGKVLSPTHRPPLVSRKYSCFSFLLDAESNPGP